jgi:Uma2 family endonuclease
MSRKLAKRWITTEEYERMGEAGIFPQDARLELIEGEIYEMSPIGSPHAACVKFLSRLLNDLFGKDAIVGTQDPIHLDDFSEPQPDVTLLRWRDDFYRSAHPTPADVLLVVEVADTTVETDRKIKIPLYARAGIKEAWIVNIPDERIEVYTDPSDDAYGQVKEFARGERAQSETLANLNVGVAELIG